MIFTRSPFRFPLGGGGTDLPSYCSKFGGFLVTSAIDKYVYLNVNRPIVDELIRVKYSRSETVASLEDVKHDLVREALRLTGITKGIEILSLADVPAGTGLGSSSSFAVGILNGLFALKREFPSPQQLAETACHLEIDILRKPIGKQDQYAAALGGIVVMHIDRDGRVQLEPPEISPETIRALEYHLLVFYTKIERNADDILAEEVKAVQGEDENTIGRLHQIKQIGEDVLLALRRGQVRRFGELLDDHWRVKRGISSKMSSDQIDRWYALAKENGAIGGKIMGAGGGGFFLFYAEDGKDRLRRAFAAEGLREMAFRFDFEGSKVLINF